MRKVLDISLWSFLFVFFVPTLLIIVSWGSLPGEALFPVKLSMEQVLAVIISPSYEAKSKLQVRYTERRFVEAKRLLADRHSVQGLPYLVSQVAATKAVIYRAPNKQLQRELAADYIITLSEVLSELEEEKGSIERSYPAYEYEEEPLVSAEELAALSSFDYDAYVPEYQPTPVPTIIIPLTGGRPLFWATPTPRVTLESNPTPAPTPTPAPIIFQPPPDDVVDEISAAQEEIEEVIEELREVAPGLGVQSATPAYIQPSAPAPTEFPEAASGRADQNRGRGRRGGLLEKANEAAEQLNQNQAEVSP